MIKLEEIVGYLPYGLKYYNEYSHKKGIEHILIELDTYGFLELTNYEAPALLTDTHIKPILRPLSDLTKEIEVNGEKFVPMVELETTFGYEYLNSYIYKNQGYFNKYAVCFGCLSYLQRWHFDIHNLIERGLAIDINTLEK
jgi:hypothetical protein